RAADELPARQARAAPRGDPRRDRHLRLQPLGGLPPDGQRPPERQLRRHRELAAGRIGHVPGPRHPPAQGAGTAQLRPRCGRGPARPGPLRLDTPQRRPVLCFGERGAAQREAARRGAGSLSGAAGVDERDGRARPRPLPCFARSRPARQPREGAIRAPRPAREGALPEPGDTHGGGQQGCGGSPPRGREDLEPEEPVRRGGATMPLRVLLPLIVLRATSAASAVRPLCAPGRFVLQGYPLIGSGRPGTDAVILETPQVSIRSGCAPVEARVWAGKRGTRIKAAWPRCGEYWRRGRLKATIGASTCETMTGAFRFG